MYGANKHTGTADPSHGFAHSLLLESNAQLDERNSVFGRAEWVQKNAEELVIPAVDPEDRFDVWSLALGYIRDVVEYDGASLGLGVRGSLNIVPTGLEPTYGTRTPAGVAVYLRLRPSLIVRAHEMEHMNHQMTQGMEGHQ